MQALLIPSFDKGKMLQGRLFFPATPSIHQYALTPLLISPDKAMGMVMYQQGAARKMSWTAGWHLKEKRKKRLDEKHNAKGFVY